MPKKPPFNLFYLKTFFEGVDDSWKLQNKPPYRFIFLSPPLTLQINVMNQSVFACVCAWVKYSILIRPCYSVTHAFKPYVFIIFIYIFSQTLVNVISFFFPYVGLYVTAVGFLLLSVLCLLLWFLTLCLTWRTSIPFFFSLYIYIFIKEKKNRNKISKLNKDEKVSTQAYKRRSVVQRYTCKCRKQF